MTYQPDKLEILHMDPSGLRLHSSLKTQHGMADDDPQFLSLCDDVAANGILEPIKITQDNQIADGRHRWRAAKRMQLVSVPCIVIPHNEVAGTVLRSLVLRRHYTKGQIAYIIYPLVQDAFEEARMRRIAKIREEMQTSLRVTESKTVDEWVRELGVSLDVLKQARKIHQTFEMHPDWREEDEPKILASVDPISLGKILAGFGGRESTKGKPMAEIPDRQFDLFNEAASTFGKRFTYWPDFNDHQKREAISSITAAIEAMPDDALNETYIRTKAIINRRKENTK